jgi:hypothetical protein
MYADGARVEDAFRAVRRRPGDRGTRGDIGTGADDYIVISAQPILLADARTLAALLLAGDDSRQRDPGAAAAIAVHSPAAHTPPQAPDGWLFVGRTHA